MHSCSVMVLAIASLGASPIRFRPVVVCDACPGGYQVAVADLNGDRRPDILGLGETPGKVEWLENPGKADTPWSRRPISGTKTKRDIDLAVCDVDRDGLPDVMVASNFDLGHSDLPGAVSWFRREGRDTEEWKSVQINAEPTAHRVRWADVDGDGRKEIITAPIIGKGAKPPTYQEAPARLTCQWIPDHPGSDKWPLQVIDETLTVLHGIYICDWDGDGRDDLMTASNQGIHLFKTRGQGLDTRWTRTQLAAGHVGSAPNRGSSEIAVGRVKGKRSFLAAIEPWHGNEVVVYAPPTDGADQSKLWQREVIDDSLRAGHALCVADLEGDGTDEIVAGFRGEGTSLYGYRRTANASPHWERFVIDAGGIAAQGVVAADVDGDGRIDLVATGGSTHNVKLYLNETDQVKP